ncbi:MAG: rhomboid family intramembrane serine protease [Chloroflexi bacterium]|nr:rhomboid family intramembrane serine protease [Chloroflexota bacterium]
MLPLRDLNPARRFPIVTIVIIGINVLVFLWEILLPSQEALEGLIYTAGLIPYHLTHSPNLSSVVSIFTSMFLHGSWMHLLGNMLFLWIFGDNVESVMGHFFYPIFYIGCGVMAALAQVFVGPNSMIPTIGASGAIAGVLGAYLIIYPGAQVETLFLIGYFVRLVRLPALVVLGLWIVLQFFNGLLSLGVATAQTGGVAWFAHIGGFLTGALMGVIFRPLAERQGRWSGRYPGDWW